MILPRVSHIWINGIYWDIEITKMFAKDSEITDYGLDTLWVTEIKWAVVNYRQPCMK